MAKGKIISIPKGTKIPDHIAIIPDGNRRWARARGFHTFEGHRRGFNAAVKVARAARQFGVHTVTLWGFSTENWDRTNEEINYLMKMYEKLIDDYLKEAKKEGVRIFHLGRKDRLPKFLLKKIVYAEESTRNNNRYIMNIAIDYGGQDDILRAVKKIIQAGIKPKDLTTQLFTSYTDLAAQPYPYVDLMIRTSGEQRSSGFLLWHSAYTEYYWENEHFPDFTPEKLKVAILDYSRRRRRFGGNDVEEHLKFKPEMVAKLELNWWRLANIPQGTRFRDYALKHVKEQFGLSKDLAKEAAYLMTQAVAQGKESKWKEAKTTLKKFYKLIKGEVKLAFEPEIVTSLEVKLNKELEDKNDIRQSIDAEETARELYAEVYRISLLQAAKLAHLRVLANIERNLAEKGLGEHHWVKAEDYLQKFYSALKERVA
ncbi:di-trans,poly-cis-decaprenylcistransferase [Candidatus Woesebacteria bacterium RBG_13_34_9]|uniref:Isoprenyl transferase n=1 Tax=Candidatus Woesebacteria bacterium RBG_13_34_9 TaxID=1802477 RepID=A0A1F7X311_9BACT|nr:MAG: di-trans,poly-cis-decaprenylcistransferase [Candidatus Woesebacteria bacterium RBG_13_34_9]